MNLIPLFLVSLAAVGYETALTRYFAVAKWSEYGYWVISIVMAGFALSGVVLALFRDALARNAAWLMAALPSLLVLTAAAGFRLTADNPFNPLQLQNPVTWQAQLWNIGLYYAGLLPFFFLAGLFVSLNFVINTGRIGRVYGYDLTGAGAGSALVLAAMYVVHAFQLVPLLLVPLALSALFGPPPQRWRGGAVAVLALVAGEALLLLGSQPAFNDFKAIYAPLHTPDAKLVAEIYSPRGDYALLDDFTERADTDISNNTGLLDVPGPPRSFGLYRDGNRIASLPMPGGTKADYAPAALSALPYSLVPKARVLLAGASGGFRISEALALGASHVRVLEPEPILFGALSKGLGPSPAYTPNSRVELSPDGPMADAGQGGPYDIIDVSADFLDAAEANVSSLTAEAIRRYVTSLSPQGIVSLPVSIRDFPVYALRMMATARTALREAGVDNPASHILVYRSAWNARILIARTPWDAARIAAARRFCDDRSFDVSWYPGIDVAAARAGLYNDLPAVSFDSGQVTASGPDDAIADEAGAVLTGRPTASAGTFNLSPVTLDRPFFYSVLRLDRLETLLRRLEILPQAEIAGLVNLAVLVQALVIAALVLSVPLLAPARITGRLRRSAKEGLTRIGLLRPVLYFPALGLGFLFIEIYLIDKASFWLNDRTAGFALVLTGMLVFSGIGSMAADRLALSAPRAALSACCMVVLGWAISVGAALDPAILATLSWPWAAKVALLCAVLAPVSLALGLPFPLGLARTNQGGRGFLPWAWGLNGAFSVVATPLANLIAREAGFSRVLLCAAILYAVALATFPAARKVRAWQDISAPSRAGR